MKNGTVTAYGGAAGSKSDGNRGYGGTGGAGTVTITNISK